MYAPGHQHARFSEKLTALRSPRESRICSAPLLASSSSSQRARARALRPPHRSPSSHAAPRPRRRGRTPSRSPTWGCTSTRPTRCSTPCAPTSRATWARCGEAPVTVSQRRARRLAARLDLAVVEHGRRRHARHHHHRRLRHPAHRTAGGKTTVLVYAPDAADLASGAYALLEELGARFFHPKQELVPALGAPAPPACPRRVAHPLDADARAAAAHAPPHRVLRRLHAAERREPRRRRSASSTGW